MYTFIQFRHRLQKKGSYKLYWCSQETRPYHCLWPWDICFDDESIFKGPASQCSCSSPALTISLTCSGIIDVSGVTMMRTAVTGACRKCGYAGHLAFQCRNFLQPKDSKDAFLDISSTSSESDYETPLTSKGDFRI